jgi:hypothetical protein
MAEIKLEQTDKATGSIETLKYRVFFGKKKKVRSCYTIGGATHVKIFLEMAPLGVKTCGESEFDIFEAKKRFPDSEKAYCALKRKVTKMQFFALK